MPQLEIKRMLFIGIVGLIVYCVVMQMVGVEASLWDSSHIEDTSVELSILGASGLVADTVDIAIFPVVGEGDNRYLSATQSVFVVSIFRPPDFS